MARKPLLPVVKHLFGMEDLTDSIDDVKITEDLVADIKPETPASIDIIRVDVPLFIRLLEFSREDAKDDAELHILTERLTAACAGGEAVGMMAYDDLVKDLGKPEDGTPADPPEISGVTETK